MGDIGNQKRSSVLTCRRVTERHWDLVTWNIRYHVLNLTGTRAPSDLMIEEPGDQFPSIVRTPRSRDQPLRVGAGIMLT